MFNHQHLTTLHMASQNADVHSTIDKLTSAGVDWSKIMAVLMSMAGAIMSKNWAAVVAALLQLLPSNPVPAA